MDCAPLNLAHFHERRADKLLRRHRYEEALKAIETSLLYVEDTYKYVKIPKAIEVLNTQKWDYKRKLKQIEMRKVQHEKMKSKEIVPSVQNEKAPNNVKTDIVNGQSVARSIDKTVKDFNDKYGSIFLGTNQQMQVKENSLPNNSSEQRTPKLKDSTKEMLNTQLEINIKGLSLMENHLHTQDDDLPCLAPLELPSFDYNVFGVIADSESNYVLDKS